MFRAKFDIKFCPALNPLILLGKVDVRFFTLDGERKAYGNAEIIDKARETRRNHRKESYLRTPTAKLSAQAPKTS